MSNKLDYEFSRQVNKSVGRNKIAPSIGKKLARDERLDTQENKLLTEDFELEVMANSYRLSEELSIVRTEINKNSVFKFWAKGLTILGMILTTISMFYSAANPKLVYTDTDELVGIALFGVFMLIALAWVSASEEETKLRKKLKDLKEERGQDKFYGLDN